jgi:hypothetical protein
MMENVMAIFKGWQKQPQTTYTASGSNQPQETSSDPAPHNPQTHSEVGPGPFMPSSEDPSLHSSFPDGVKVLHDCADATVDICFVHGLTGNRDSTWTAHGQSMPWPMTLLPSRLGRVRILTYGYNAYIVQKSVASSNRLTDHAMNLLKDLTDDRAYCNASCRPIIFVAHSLGGLVCKKAILLSRDNREAYFQSIFDWTKGIIFMGTPHRGSWMADWAKIPASALGLVKSSNKTLLQILQADNELLADIRDRFAEMILKLSNENRSIKVVCFFEELPLLGVGKVVSRDSATLEGYNAISIHANHSDMVKFCSAEDNGFKRLLGELARWVAEVQSNPPERPKAIISDDDTYMMDEKDCQCLKDLQTTDPRDDKARIEKSKGGLLEDSYSWILENTEFVQWRDVQNSQLLWIKGDPGKGKTMLLCGIINELQKSTVKMGLLSFFFCEGADVRINNATAILRGLIYMLIDQQPSLIRCIREKYDRVGKSLFEDVNAWIALSGILENILQDPSLKSAYLIIDALDECQTEDLPQLLDFIVQTSSASSHVKWIVSSRNWPNIEERLETARQKVRLCLELNAESISTAVGIYIRHKVLWLTRLKNYDNKTRDAVQHHLSSNANDTFLWVALVCQNLEKISRVNTLTKLNIFPAGLDPLYRRMMEQVCNSDNADLCKRILAITTIVYRPVTLKELSSFVDMVEIASDLESLAEIIRLCGSFLTLREHTVHFVHQSAKDFLLKKAFDEIFISGVGDIHYTIFSRSLEVMSSTLRRDMYGLCAPGFPIDKVEQPDPDPLAAAGYSCVYWIDHFCDWDSSKSAKQRDDMQDRGAIDKFLRQKYLYWLEALGLLRSVSEGVLSMEKLEGLCQVSFKSIVLSRNRSNITLGKSRGITIDRLSPRCSPIYSLLQVGNREHSSPDIHISTHLQSGSQPDERVIQARGARMDYNQASYAR